MSIFAIDESQPAIGPAGASLQFSIMSASSQELHAVLTAIRSARFVDGVSCPHCSARAVQRWGSFSGRCRYRCRQCARSFSDLTHTAAAHCKRIHLWQRYMSCMDASMTIRRSAAAIGVHPTTAFRWRHRVLAAALQADDSALTGRIEIEAAKFLYSEKGRRNLTRPPRRRGYWAYGTAILGARHVCALVACDRAGTTVWGVLSTQHPYDRDIHDCIMTRVHGRATILARARMVSAYGRAARKSGHTYISVPRYPPVTAGTGLAKVWSQASGGAGASIASGSIDGEVNSNSPGEPGIRATDGPEVAEGHGIDDLVKAKASDLGVDASNHTASALACICRVRGWLPRFRGVATRFLEHYLTWHRLLDTFAIGPVVLCPASRSDAVLQE